MSIHPHRASNTNISRYRQLDLDVTLALPLSPLAEYLNSGAHDDADDQSSIPFRPIHTSFACTTRTIHITLTIYTPLPYWNGTNPNKQAKENLRNSPKNWPWAMENTGKWIKHSHTLNSTCEGNMGWKHPHMLFFLLPSSTSNKLL